MTVPRSPRPDVAASGGTLIQKKQQKKKKKKSLSTTLNLQDGRGCYKFASNAKVKRIRTDPRLSLRDVVLLLLFLCGFSFFFFCASGNIRQRRLISMKSA